MEFRDFDHALKMFKFVKYHCQQYEKYREELTMHKQIGYIYRIKGEHQLALGSFSWCIELAWDLSDTSEEIEVYLNMAIEYYYIGNLDLTKVYEERYRKDLTEPRDSLLIKIA